ncbi:MFS general substrate transporter [Calocera cornea HHB12733]|uniref:MFS general substrate transporter n=1 Tax=Calocera cornea HHB12733 TaxID=1353952 RepID=A0A165K0C4_9BASI|nr:MFS general substrate transporter [Calocera cornea HHB12733]
MLRALRRKAEEVEPDIPLEVQPASSVLKESTTSNAAPVETSEGPDVPVIEQSPEARMTKVELQLTFIALSVTGFLAALDAAIVATAMPTIASEFDSLSQQSWIALSYLLTSTVFQPFFGRATDLYGSRTMLFIAMFIFELGSLLCAVAQNFVWLCAARGVAGMGGAGIEVVMMVIVSQIVSLRERGNYMGIMYARYAIAMVAGPTLGGVFTNYNWRWCFWINLIIAVPALAILIALARKLPAARKTNVTLRDIDYIGTILLSVSTVSLSLAFNWAGIVYAWGSPIIIALIAVGGAMVPAFVCWEIWGPSFPIIPMDMFKYRNVRASTANYFFTSVSNYGTILYLPSYYQLVRRDAQLISGLELLPYLIPMLLATTLVGRLISKTGRIRTWLWAGGAVNMLGTGLLIMLNGTLPRGVEYLFILICGLGMGFVFQSNTLSAQSEVGKELLASVTTMTMWSKSLGGIFGIAMQGSILTSVFKQGILASSAAAPYVTRLLAVDNVSSLPSDVQSIASTSYGNAFHTMMIATTAFCAPGFLFSLTAGKHKLE